MYTTKHDGRDGKVKDWYAAVGLCVSSKGSNAFMGKKKKRKNPKLLTNTLKHSRNYSVSGI